ncbi:hypothetical protein PIB30_068862 [Stylosanthes scabra]|uniref:Uncharacterized protein n=1 Tax=Stylosanthes scabra TaxID=79078 RepID=A0ABU6UMF3_9FABA|nr:hypothetical protein [Stylosanthes scabra]
MQYKHVQSLRLPQNLCLAAILPPYATDPLVATGRIGFEDYFGKQDATRLCLRSLTRIEEKYVYGLNYDLVENLTQQFLQLKECCKLLEARLRVFNLAAGSDDEIDARRMEARRHGNIFNNKLKVLHCRSSLVLPLLCWENFECKT